MPKLASNFRALAPLLIGNSGVRAKSASDNTSSSPSRSANQRQINAWMPLGGGKKP